ncbi:hypothetical protein ARC78_08005 [Stenotrophomonas pictorum JCM 9942]|uniref:Replicative DNA helicase n=2 Tax=Stenotrophomonas pictorum TaxID=86184 RepID=A0A0R0ADB2_9GAMM|nr:hypothetical protein [Stenotrophomonas pictorum]KRG42918.1 hypothetical protein ARC78_08005 [Stenotrophomonas pictorum JCM 9942]
MNIPPDIHARVVELTDTILHAGQSGDAEAAQAAYRALADYGHAVAAEGRDHPFLWETLADFTGDDRLAIALYLRALPLATAADACGYAASICLALAERHVNLDEPEAARDYARQADGFAGRTDDLPLRRDIRQFLLDHASPADRH